MPGVAVDGLGYEKDLEYDEDEEDGAGGNKDRDHPHLTVVVVCKVADVWDQSLFLGLPQTGLNGVFYLRFD